MYWDAREITSHTECLVQKKKPNKKFYFMHFVTRRRTCLPLINLERKFRAQEWKWPPPRGSSELLTCLGEKERGRDRHSCWPRGEDIHGTELHSRETRACARARARACTYVERCDVSHGKAATSWVMSSADVQSGQDYIVL